MKIISIVHHSFPKNDINIQFKVDKYHPKEAIDFLREWGSSLPERPIAIASN